MKSETNNLMLALLLIFSAVGCITDTEVTNRADVYTDYVIGQKYRLQKPVFLFKVEPGNLKEIPTLTPLGTSGTPDNLDEFRLRMKADGQVAGLLEIGDEIQTVKLTEHSSPTVGKTLILRAIVVSGKCRGMIAELSMVSETDYSHNRLLIKPEYLMPTDGTR